MSPAEKGIVAVLAVMSALLVLCVSIDWNRRVACSAKGGLYAHDLCWQVERVIPL